MLLKKVCTEFAIFEADDPNRDLEDILVENVEKFPLGPCNDTGGGDQSQAHDVSDISDVRPKRKKKRDQGNNVRDLITAFAICNNVTPVDDDPNLARALDVQGPEDYAGRNSVPPNAKSSLLGQELQNSPEMRARRGSDSQSKHLS
mmetsp:Transcript_9424/g.14426  ORF Transcript_9424/g.14426 Transcript_9424/m.14426 type:complete len:146 (-) Transcript_9424:1751-2188(-)